MRRLRRLINGLFAWRRPQKCDSSLPSYSSLRNEPEATGYCLSCGAYLMKPQRWCGPSCLFTWSREGAAYARMDGDVVTVEETNAQGTVTRTQTVPLY